MPGEPGRPSMMRKAALGALAALWVIFALLGAPARAQAPGGRIFHVDFAGGSNAADGLSPATAWKHSPGDTAADGRPAAVQLRGGDIVRFRGGVVYRGSLRGLPSGSPDNRIRFQGDGWGPGKAILSGRDSQMTAFRRCADDPACASLSARDDLQIADLPAAMDATGQAAIDGRVLNLAQSPGLPDPFWSDDITAYNVIARTAILPVEGGWRLTHPALRSLSSKGDLHDAFLYLWGMPNLIYTAKVRGIDAAVGALVAQAPKFRPYMDRDGRFAVANHVAFIQNEMDFATMGNGSRLVVAMRGGSRRATIEIGRRKTAIDATGASSISFEGFVIEGYSGDADARDGGVALLLAGRSRDIAFINNHVRDLDSRAGAGAVQAIAVEGLQVDGNTFERLRHGSGVRTGASARNVRISGNRFERIGRTAVAIIGSQDVAIEDNTIEESRGVHGNAISIYLATSNVVVVRNLVMRAVRGITFHGGGGQPNDLAIKDNIVIVDGASSVGIQSWGRATTGVDISGNLVLAPAARSSVYLNVTDRRVSVTGNVLEGLYIPGAVPADWRVSGNRLVRGAPANFRQAASIAGDNASNVRLPPAVCSGCANDTAALCNARSVLGLPGAGPSRMCR
jgi:hypothetical protein